MIDYAQPVRMTFGDLWGTLPLEEKLSFDKLMSMSDPKRVTRSNTVRMPPLKFDAFKDTTSYYFNCKSSPSTTGLRQKGTIRCFKPKNPDTPLEKCECEVDCTCPDYRYRFAWANKQRGSGKVGPDSLNQSLNRAPRKTNPGNRPGLCKHIIKLREWVYGKYHSFDNDRDAQDTPSKLDRMVKDAQKRIVDEPGLISKAKEKEKELKAAWDRIRGRPKTPGEPEKPGDVLTGTDKVKAKEQRDAKKAAKAAPPPGSNPQNQDTGAEPENPEADELLPEVDVEGKPKKGTSGPKAPPGKPSARRSTGSPSARRSESVLNHMIADAVKDLTRIVEELEGEAATIQSDMPGSPAPVEGEEENELLDTIRKVLDIVRHMAGADLPPDLKGSDEDEEHKTPEEPGIPPAAVQSSEDN